MKIEDNNLYNWSLLDQEAKAIREQILIKWKTLLSLNLKEEDYHQFICEHSGFFFSPFNNIFFTITKLRMGSDFVTDLI